MAHTCSQGSQHPPPPRHSLHPYVQDCGDPGEEADCSSPKPHPGRSRTPASLWALDMRSRSSWEGVGWAVSRKPGTPRWTALPALLRTGLGHHVWRECRPLGHRLSAMTHTGHSPHLHAPAPCGQGFTAWLTSSLQGPLLPRVHTHTHSSVTHCYITHST